MNVGCGSGIVGLKVKPKYQWGMADLDAVTEQPRWVFCSPAFHRQEWSEFTLKYIGFDVKQDKSLGIVQEVRWQSKRHPKRWIIIKRISLFGNKRELEQISCGRFSAILANLWSHVYIIHGAPAQNLSDAPSVTSTFRHYSWPRLPTEPPVYRTRLHKDKQDFFDNYMMIALLISRKFWRN